MLQRGRSLGHNLLEMVVASVVFCTAVGSLSATWVLHAQASAKARTRVVALYLAQQACEEALTQGYPFVKDLATTYASQPPIVMTVENAGQIITTNYTVALTVTDPGANGPLTRDVLVTVSWEESGGTRQVQRHTMVSRVGG